MKKKNLLMTVVPCMLVSALLWQGSSVQAAEDTFVSEAQKGTGYIQVEEEYQTEAKSIYSEEESLIKSANFPASYRTEKLPAIKDQGSYGTCWAFSTLTLLETNMMKNGHLEDDYSEMHLAYYTYHSALDAMGGLAGDDRYDLGGIHCLTDGGNFEMAASTLMNWKGAAAEELMPHNENTANLIANNQIPGEYAFNDVAYMKNCYYIDATKEAEIKQAIMNYGAVAISYYVDGAFYSQSTCWNPATAAYYCPTEGKLTTVL